MALIEPRELNHRLTDFDFWICQLARMRRARPLVTALKKLRKRGAIESADSALTLEIEDVEHVDRLVHEGYQLDVVEVKNSVDQQAELLSSSALLAADSSLLSERKGHRRCTERLNKKLTLIEVE